MRRLTALLLLVVILVGVFPAPALATDPVTLTYSYSQYLAAMQAAGLTYGAKTYNDLAAEGISDREAIALESVIRSSVRNSSVSAGLVVTPSMVMAQKAYLVSQDLWTGFQSAVASAYAYGSYAWLRLQSGWSAYWGVKGADIAGTTVTYTGTPAWNSAAIPVLAACQALTLKSDQTDPRDIALATDAYRALSGTAGASGLTWFWHDYGNNAYIWLETTAGGGSPGVQVCFYTQLGFYKVATGSTAMLNQAQAVLNTKTWTLTGGTVGTMTKPAPVTPDVEEMPEDPFPGDPWETPPQQPSPFPIPAWKWNNPDTTFGQPPGGGQVAPPTVEDPAPYVPPAGTDTTPIPPGGIPALGDNAREAAEALDQVVPDSLAWLKAPFIAILNWLGGFWDWVQNCWNTVCGWVAGLFVPSDAGLAAAWTQPWASLQSKADSRWPWAIGSIVTDLLNGIRAGGGSKTAQLTFSLPLGHGQTLQVDLDNWFGKSDEWRWLGTALMWLGGIISFALGMRPRVVT